jgi:hypothetical protein
MTAHGILLAVGVQTLSVFVAFIGSYTNNGTSITSESKSIKKVDRPEHVSCKSFDGNFIGQTNQRLCGEVKDNFRRKIYNKSIKSNAIR